MEMKGGNSQMQFGSQEGYYGVAIIMALNSAIAVYYYLKLVVYMFLKEPDESRKNVVYANRAFSLELVIGIAAFVTITSIFYIEPLMSFITDLVGASGY